MKRIEAVKLQKHFTPLQLPIEPEFRTLIKRKYPDYLFTSQIIKEPYIVDHHIKRDRTEVIKIENVLYSIDSIEIKVIKRPVDLWLAIKHKFTGYKFLYY